MKKVLHIGANKTASSLLQRQLFKKHKNLSYLGEESSTDPQELSVLRLLIQEDDSFYSPEETQLLFAKYAQPTSNKTFVFSSEDIMTSRMPTKCAERLYSLMGDTKVVMVIRNQLTTWPSWYANHGAFLKNVPKRYWQSYVGFEEWLDFCFAFPNQTPVEAMNYFRFYTIFANYFGEENIHVLLYEDLIKHPNIFYQQWAKLLGLSEEEVATSLKSKIERPRITNRKFQQHRWLRRFPFFFSLASKYLATWLNAGPAFSIPIPDSYRKLIEKYYAPGNTQLARKIGVDLSLYHYPI